MGWLVVWLFIDVLLALIPASIARSKGRTTYGGWWLYGFFFFPIALIHSLVMEPSEKPSSAYHPPSWTRLSEEKLAEQLAKLWEQHEDGLISDETYRLAQERLRRASRHV